jgi:O-antigen/teichoic acid export membrane protein
MQHKTTLLLLTNHAVNAVAGFGFWLVFIRVTQLDATAIGIGFTVVAVGTAIGLVARGGLATALMRHVPKTHGAAGNQLYALATIVGCILALVATPLAWLALGARMAHSMLPADWMMAGGLAVLLIVAWMQDAYLLARGRVGSTVVRNAAFSAMKLALPLAFVLWPLRGAVAYSWLGSLLVAAVCGQWLIRRIRIERGSPSDVGGFRRSAWRNTLSNASEFLPGLVLTPIVLAREGAAAAAYFGMAWTVASLLFLAITAIGRSSLTQMVRGDHPAVATRKAVVQAVILILPAAALGTVMARIALLVFGADYAAAATNTLQILLASVVFVIPSALYLDVLRARELTRPLNLLPVGLLLGLFVLAPLLVARMGIEGVAWAWLIVNAPFGLWSMGRIAQIVKENPHETQTDRSHPNPE